MGFRSRGWLRQDSRFATFQRKILLGFSDQLLITSFGVQIAGYIRYRDLTVYHHGVITDIAVFSALTHCLTLLCLRDYFLLHHLARRVRILFMLPGIIFLVANAALVGVLQGWESVSLKSDILSQRVGATGWEVWGFGALFGLPIIMGLVSFTIFTIWTISYQSAPRILVAKGSIWVPIVTGICIYLPLMSLVRTVVHLQAILSVYGFKGSAPGVIDTIHCDSGSSSELHWGYGQVSAMVFLLIPVLNAVGVYSGMWESTASGYSSH